MKNFSIHISILLLLSSVFASAQTILRTENGIVDLLNESTSEESEVYRQQLSAFRLQGADRRVKKGSILSLGMKGPVVNYKDQVQNRDEVIEKYIAEKRWKKALAEINDGLALNPDNRALLKLAAYVNTILKDFYMANYYYGRYYERNPEDVDVLSNWAGILIRTFNFKDAMDLLDQALELNPGHLPSRFYQLTIALADEEREVDRRSWETLQLSSKSEIAGWIGVDADNYRNVLGPKGFAQLCDLAIGAGTIDRIDELTQVFNDYYEGERSDDQDQELQRRLGLLEQLEDLGVDGIAIPLERAILAYKGDDLQGALAIMEDLIARYPDDELLLTHYGYTLLQDGRYSKAETQLRRAVELGSGVDAKVAFASALMMTGNSDDAWELIWEVTEADPRAVFNWLQEDAPYIRRTISDKRYDPLCNRLGIPPESR